MRSFLTGSHVYGTPKPDSDIDLVVLVSPEHLAKLREFADADYKWNNDYHTAKLSFRFGKLNLICCTNEIDFNVWKEGTEKLQEIQPVTREDAVALFTELRGKQ